jgi:hypothetical protein
MVSPSTERAERRRRRPARDRVVAIVAAAGIGVCVALPQVAGAQSRPGAGGIYSCIDANGRRLTSDRPIPECNAREQRVHNDDGSVRRVVPPSLTADERAAREAEERRQAAEQVARRDAARRDRNLMGRFPDEAAHRAAREQALDNLRRAMAASEARLNALSKERKPLNDEAEFYAGRTLPIKLKQQIDANDAATRAQRDAVQTQRLELERVNALFDAELERLKRLWAGAAPGSLGPAPTSSDDRAGPSAGTRRPADRAAAGMSTSARPAP